MKAIQIREHGGAEVLQYVDVEVPEPGPGQVRIRVRAAGLNPADTYQVRGGYEFYDAQLPWVPGFDSAGEVDAVGADVSGLRVGDRVFVVGILAASSGAFAQYHVADARVVHPLPAHVSFEQGAAIGTPYPTAYRALFQLGGLRPGQAVLVHGASGGVGQACVQFARATGARVIATAGSQDGLALVRELGADHVIDHSGPDHIAAITELAPEGIDLVVELAASANLDHDMGLLARDGTIVVVGARTPVEINPRQLMKTEGRIRGLVLWHSTPRQSQEAIAAIAAGLANGTLAPVIGPTVALSELGRGFSLVTSGHRTGKVIVTVE